MARRRGKSKNQTECNKEPMREQPRKDSGSKRINLDNERVSKFEKKITVASNDVAWYAHNPELLRAAASVPFTDVVGHEMFWNVDGVGLNQTSSTSVRNKIPQRVPGVMALYWQPTIGPSTSNAINVAKDMVFSYTIHANSRIPKYTAEDQMLVILAGIQIFNAIAFATRAYGIIKDYNQNNKYKPETIIRAMGFDYEDLKNHLSDMWFDLNQFVADSTQIWIPNTMPILTRQFWMNSHVYTDANGPKAQMYLYVPEGFWMYDETGSPMGGYLKWAEYTNSQGTKVKYSNMPKRIVGTTDFGNQNHTWKEFREMLSAMIDALVESQDRGLIMGDLLNAYGADKIYAMNPINVDYSIQPVYDREVLTQFENATYTNCSIATIAQNPDTAKLETHWTQQQTVIASTVQAVDRSILNFHDIPVPTPADIMVATRMKVQGAELYKEGNKNNIRPITFGSELVVGIYSFVFYKTANLATPMAYQYWANLLSKQPGPNADAPTLQPEYNLLTCTAFDWCPWMYECANTSSVPESTTGVWNTDAGIGQIRVISPVAMAYGDYDNYTTLDTYTLDKMHTTALFSEFNVPSAI